MAPNQINSSDVPLEMKLIWIFVLFLHSILVGASNGNLAIYELRQNKCQMIRAHSNSITALAFSPDGKFLVSYSCGENRLSFWQTSTGKIEEFILSLPFFSYAKL